MMTTLFLMPVMITKTIMRLSLSIKDTCPNFLGPIGGKAEREHNKIMNREILGIEYTLPLLIKADLRVNTKGKLRFASAH
jgi:hypothetical protein